MPKIVFDRMRTDIKKWGMTKRKIYFKGTRC